MAETIRVYNDEELEALTPEQREAWKGYIYKMTYEIWDEESLEIGETDNKGWAIERSLPFDALYNILCNIEADANWLEWSDSHPGEHSWINSEGETDTHSGDITNNSLWIERADGLPMSEEEILYISRHLGLRHPKIERISHG
jgi:hypothetical protein